MPLIRWRNFVTAADDPTIGPVSVLSLPAEVHALLYGLLAGLTGVQAVVVAFLLFILGWKDREGLFEALLDVDPGGTGRFPKTGHLRDAIREPAYAVAGVLAGLSLHAAAWSPPAWLLDLFVAVVG